MAISRNPAEQAPPVVAVVVACDPAHWFEECLKALAAQDYPNLDVLVVDAASHEDLTARVAAMLPRAFITRQAENRGFSAAANEALAAVEGASHLLICHDDVAPARDAVRRMVEEAYRSNAGIVGPKLVRWDAPDRLLQVGLGVDRFGRIVERVEPGELDQAQHDEVREVFAVPGGCMLVRADLFRALGGFDPEIDLFGEDVDLCWRAQVAAARVVVAPAARVRHLQAAQSGSRQVGDVAALRQRHELRAALKNYGWPRRSLVRLELIVASIAQLLAALVRGDRERAKRVRGAWRWNLSRWRSLRAARKALSRARQRPDRSVALLFTRSPRHSAAGSGEGGGAAFDSTVVTEPEARVPTRVRRYTRGSRGDEAAEQAVPAPEVLVAGRTVVWGVVGLIAVVLFGLRNLLLGRLPLVGQLLPFPAATSLLREFFSGWAGVGWQTTGPAPPAFGLIGLLGAILVGSTAQAEKLLLLAPVVVGALGIHRLLRPLGSRRARLAATIAYLGLPIVWNDIAAGNLQALVAFAGMPFVLARLSHATRLPPFTSSQDPVGWRGVLSDIVPFGLLVALIAALSPPAAVAVAALSVGVALGSVAAGRPAASLRSFGVAAGAFILAFVCLLPWSLTFVQKGARWSILGGAVGSSRATGGILRMLRFAVGPVGAGWLGWGLIVGAGFVLLVARKARLDWATRWWVAALVTVAVAYAGATGWLGAGGGATLVLLSPAACCLAAAVGLGVAAFELDLATSRFGWRQNLSVGAALCLAVGLFPTLVSTVDGRSSLPSVGYEQLLSWTAKGREARGYEVLWLGEPAAVPAPAWQVQRGLAFAVSENGLPDGRRLWPSPDPGVGAGVEFAVSQAEDGLTVRLGASLARAGIRYIVVPEAVAPTLPGVQVPPAVAPPASLVQALQAQSDLRQLPTEGGVVAFANTAWPLAGSPVDDSVVALGPARSTAPAWERSVGLAAGLLTVAVASAASLLGRRRRRFRSGAGTRAPGGRSGPAPGDSRGRRSRSALAEPHTHEGQVEPPAGAAPEPPAGAAPEPASSTLL